MRKNRSAPLLAILTLLFLGAGIAETASSQIRPLTGIVAENSSGQPLPNASVMLTEIVERDGQSRQDPARFGSATNLDGAFSIEVDRSGRFGIEVRFVGFIPHRDTLTLPLDAPLEIRLRPDALEVNPITVTASRRPERRLDAPSSVTVIDARQLESQVALTVADNLKDAPAVDVIRTGLNQSRVVVRGFNDNLASNLLTLVDNRIARAPAVRLTAMQLIPTSGADMERMEVVSGPASALYGPNAANGVVHVVTKSPFDAPGTSFAISGGQQSLRSGSLRHAAVLSSRWAYKVTAQYYTGEDFEYFSPAENQARSAAIVSGADPDTLRIGLRDFGVSNTAMTARLEGRFSPDLVLYLDGGFTRGDNIEVTPTGAAQVDGARLGYAQARLRRGDLFVQAYGNFLNSGNSYFLRTGESFIDKSRLYVVQAQHFSEVGSRTQLTYGIDWFRTIPNNEGTVSGGYEDSDQMNEPGVYLQSDTDLSARLALTLAGRVDYHSRLEEAYFSPRAALVFKPRNAHNFRLTYNRAFKSPASNQLFGDVLGARDLFGLGGLGGVFGVSGRTDLRAQGMFGGFSFSRGSNGLPRYRSPFADDPGAYIDLNDPAMTARMWDIARFATVSGLAENLVAGGFMPAGSEAAVSAALESVLPTSLGGVANQLQVLDLDSQQFSPIADVVDQPQMTITRTETVELGYKGLIGRSLVVGVDAYWSRIRDFVGPLFVGTPNVFLDPATLSAALMDTLPTALAADPASEAALAGLDTAPLFGGGNGTPAEELATIIATGVASAIPFGTVSPQEAFDPTALVLMRRNIGDLSVWGADVSVTQFLSRSLRVGGTFGWISDDYFRAVGQSLAGTADIALNAPRSKWSAFVDFAYGSWGAAARVSASDGFPILSDVYVGEAEAFVVADASFSYRVRSESRITLAVQNLADRRYRQFVDVAELGRLAILRLEIGL